MHCLALHNHIKTPPDVIGSQERGDKQRCLLLLLLLHKRIFKVSPCSYHVLNQCLCTIYIHKKSWKSRVFELIRVIFCTIEILSRYSSRIKDDSPPPSRASGRLSRYKDMIIIKHFFRLMTQSMIPSIHDVVFLFCDNSNLFRAASPVVVKEREKSPPLTSSYTYR